MARGIKTIVQQIRLNGAAQVKAEFAAIAASAQAAMAAVDRANIAAVNNTVSGAQALGRAFGQVGFQNFTRGLRSVRSELLTLRFQLQTAAQTVSVLGSAFPLALGAAIGFSNAAANKLLEVSRAAKEIRVPPSVYKELDELAKKAGATGEIFKDALGTIDKDLFALGDTAEVVDSEYGLMLKTMKGGVETFTDVGNKVGGLAEKLGTTADKIGPVIKALLQLGVSVQDGSGNVRSSNAIFDDAAVAIGGMADGYEKSRLASILFGNDYQKMLEIIKGGLPKLSESTRDYVAELENAKVGMSRLKQSFIDVNPEFSATRANFLSLRNAVENNPFNLEIAKRFKFEFDDTKRTLDSFMQTFATQLQIELTPVIAQFRKMIETNFGSIRLTLIDFAQYLGDFAKDFKNAFNFRIEGGEFKFISQEQVSESRQYLNEISKGFVLFGQIVSGVYQSIIKPVVGLIVTAFSGLAIAINVVFGTNITGPALLVAAVLLKLSGAVRIVTATFLILTRILNPITVGLTLLFVAIDALFSGKGLGLGIGSYISAFVGYMSEIPIIMGVVIAAASFFAVRFALLMAVALAGPPILAALTTLVGIIGVIPTLMLGVIAAVGAVGVVIYAFWDDISKYGKQALDKFWEGISFFGELVVEGFKAIGLAILKSFGGSIESVRKFVQDARELIGNWLTWFKEKLEAIGIPIDKWIASFQNFVVTAMETIRPFVSWVASAFGAVGKSIESALDGAIAKAKSAANSVIESTKGLLGGGTAGAGGAGGGNDDTTQDVTKMLAKPYQDAASDINRIVTQQIPNSVSQGAKKAAAAFKIPTEGVTKPFEESNEIIAKELVPGLAQLSTAAQTSMQEVQGAVQSTFPNPFASTIISGTEASTSGFAAWRDKAISDMDALISKARELAAALAAAQPPSGGSSSGGGGQQFARGGFVSGPGTATSDSIPAWLSSGEFVVRAAAVRQYGVGFLRMLNGMRLSPRLKLGVPGFAMGGPVGNIGSAVGGDSGGYGGGLTLVLGGETFGGLNGPPDVLGRLERYASAQKLRTMGRKPTWHGGVR